MKLNKIIALIIVLCLSSTGLIAINQNAGTSGFQFLNLHFSARSSAMANAYTGLSNEVNGVFFNPAGLFQLKTKQVSSTYMNYFEGVQCGSIVYGFPYRDNINLAFFSQFLYASEDETDSEGIVQGTFTMSNVVLGANYSRYINQIFDMGINVKFIREALADNDAMAAAIDIGVMHQTTNEDVKVGLSLKNFGAQLTSHTGSEYKEGLPRTLAVGLNYHPTERFYALVDLLKPFDYDISIRTGLEYSINEFLSLRAGYNSNSGDWKAGGDWEATSGLSTGFGLNWKKYNIDYAINSYGDLGLVNQITLKYTF